MNDQDYVMPKPPVTTYVKWYPKADPTAVPALAMILATAERNVRLFIFGTMDNVTGSPIRGGELHRVPYMSDPVLHRHGTANRHGERGAWEFLDGREAFDDQRGQLVSALALQQKDMLAKFDILYDQHLKLQEAVAALAIKSVSKSSPGGSGRKKAAKKKKVAQTSKPDQEAPAEAVAD